MKKLSLISIFLGIIFIFLSLSFTITGGIVGINFSEIRISNPVLFVIGFVFIFVPTLVIMAKKLESLVIPTGQIGGAMEKRISEAKRSYSHYKGDTPYILVTGVIHRDKKGRPKKTQQYQTYSELRKYGLKPSDMIIEGKSEDTLQNFLYSIKKLKKKDIDKMKIATNRTQYWRFKLFEKEAKKQRLLDKSFEIEPLYTKETPKEFAYGVLAYIRDYFRVKSHKPLSEAGKHINENIGKIIKDKLSGK